MLAESGMHHSFIDKYSGGTSVVHRADARLKISIALIALICIISTPPVHDIALIGYAFLFGLCWIASGLPLLHLLQRIGLALPFIAVIALGTLVVDHAVPAASRYLFIIAKATLAIAVLTLLTSSTRFHNLLRGFAWFGIPRIMTSLLAFLYRYVFILIDEAERLSRGRRSRQLARRRLLAWRSRAWQIGTLFLRSMERSERVYNAMLARGFTGHIRSIESPTTLTIRQVAIGASIVCALISIRTIPSIISLAARIS